MIGFEPTTFRPPDERANRAALHPEHSNFFGDDYSDKFFLIYES